MKGKVELPVKQLASIGGGELRIYLNRWSESGENYYLAAPTMAAAIRLLSQIKGKPGDRIIIRDNSDVTRARITFVRNGIDRDWYTLTTVPQVRQDDLIVSICADTVTVQHKRIGGVGSYVKYTRNEAIRKHVQTLFGRVAITREASK